MREESDAKLMIQMCCATCVYYDGLCCTKRVKGWLAKDALTYFCRLWEARNHMARMGQDAD